MNWGRGFNPPNPGNSNPGRLSPRLILSVRVSGGLPPRKVLKYDVHILIEFDAFRQLSRAYY